MTGKKIAGPLGGVTFGANYAKVIGQSKAYADMQRSVSRMFTDIYGEKFRKTTAEIVALATSGIRLDPDIGIRIGALLQQSVRQTHMFDQAQETIRSLMSSQRAMVAPRISLESLAWPAVSAVASRAAEEPAEFVSEAEDIRDEVGHKQFDRAAREARKRGLLKGAAWRASAYWQNLSPAGKRKFDAMVAACIWFSVMLFVVWAIQVNPDLNAVMDGLGMTPNGIGVSAAAGYLWLQRPKFRERSIPINKFVKKQYPR